MLGRVALMSVLDGVRPSGIPEWVSPVIPVVTQAAVGAGHWAAGFALVAWGLGTEAPTQAEAQKNILWS